MRSADQLAEAIVAALSDGPHEVVVDLTDVSFLDSSGVRALFMGSRFATEHQRLLTVENPVPRVHRVLKTCGVLELLSAKPR